MLAYRVHVIPTYPGGGHSKGHWDIGAFHFGWFIEVLWQCKASTLPVQYLLYSQSHGALSS